MNPSKAPILSHTISLTKGINYSKSASEKPTKYELKYPLKASIPDNSLLAATAVTSLFELTINYLKNSSSVISNPIIFFAAAE